MNLTYTKIEKAVGAFLLIIIVLLFSTVVLIGRGKNWFKSYVVYDTVFDESYNLQKNAAVKLHDAAIGKVEDVILTDNKVKIKIAIMEEYQPRITATTKVTVKSPTLIGDEYLAVLPGKKKGAMLPEGATLASVPKKSLSDLLGNLQTPETARRLVAIIENIAALSERLQDPEGDLLVSLKRLETILENLARASAQAPLVMDRANQTLATFDQVGKEAHYDMGRIKTLLGDVENRLKQIKAVLSNLEKASYDIPQITRDTRQGIEEIRTTVKKTDRVIQSLQKNYFIKKNLPPAAEGEKIDAGLRQ